MQSATHPLLSSLASQLFNPFMYGVRTGDIPIHPAFLRPNLSCGTLQDNQTSEKARAFTIDAILGQDKTEDLSKKNEEYELSKTEETLRRHRRLNSIHPYFNTIASEKCRENIKVHNVPKVSDRSEKSHGGEDWRPAKSKRVRTIFTPEQLDRLEAEFERQQYMVGTERYYLATALNLTEAQVKVWFQNRRIKWRKQNLEQQQAKLKSLAEYDIIESGEDFVLRNHHMTPLEDNRHSDIDDPN